MITSLRDILEEAREVITVLDYRGERVAPLTGLLVLALSILVSLSLNPLVYLIALITSFYLLARSRHITRRVKRIVYFVAIVLAITVPSLLIVPAKTSPLLFILRAISATLLPIAFTASHGWRQLVSGLALVLPQQVVEAFEALVANIPRWLTIMLTVAVARQARTLSNPGLTQQWRLASTIVGELFVRGLCIAETIEKARKARTIGEALWKHRERVADGSTIVVLLIIIIVIVVEAFSRASG